MAERFVDLLGKEYRGQVLEFLRDRPDEMFTINEVVESVDGSYPAVRDFLRELEDLGLVKIRKKGGSYLVEFNRDSRYLEAVDTIFKTETRPLYEEAEDFVENLSEDLKQQTVSILLFGSVARGTADSNSDIDILFIVEEEMDKEEFKNKIVNKARNRDYEIVPVIETVQEFNQNFENGRRFEKNVMRDSELLYGDSIRGKIS